MKAYSLIDFYYDKTGMSCQHCGRAIKNIAVVRDNLTGEKLYVGTTCVDKLLGINEKANKLLQKRIKEYTRMKDRYMRYINLQYDLLNYIEGNLQKNLQYPKDSYNYRDPWIIVRESIHNIEFAYAQLIKHTVEFNKLSKTKLVDLESLDELIEGQKKFKERFKDIKRSYTWEYDLSNESEIKQLLNKYEII